MERTVILRFLSYKDAENKLKLLCSLSPKIWNEINYIREEPHKAILKPKELKTTYKNFYEKIKSVDKFNDSSKVLNKNN